MDTHTPTQEAASQRQVVVFRLATETYAIDIQQVSEIIRVPDITRVPQASAFIDGVINLRGNVIPVVHLRKRFGLGDQSETRDERIMVVQLDDQLIGMRVDAVTEVLTLDESQIDAPSSFLSDAKAQLIAGIAKDDARLIILVNLDKVLSDGEMHELDRVRRLMSDNGKQIA